MFTGGTLTNIAEIVFADDDENPDNTPPAEVDSTPDMDMNNDDLAEDDIDTAGIPVGQVVDLALEKEITSPAPYTL